MALSLRPRPTIALMADDDDARGLGGARLAPSTTRTADDDDDDTDAGSLAAPRRAGGLVAIDLGCGAAQVAPSHSSEQHAPQIVLSPRFHFAALAASRTTGAPRPLPLAVLADVRAAATLPSP